MSRFGCKPEAAGELAARIGSLPNTIVEGVATHFANSGKEPEYTAWQYERFQSAVCNMAARGVVPQIKHCANSGALVKFPSSLMDMARIGILAYGISHVGETELTLRPVLKWFARIMAVRDLDPGTMVSYNLTYKTERPTRIATLGVGYGDGYHRFLGNRGNVLVRGRHAPIRGVVCMDQLMVDITDIPEAKVGDPAGLIEGDVNAEYLAGIVGTTPHEITTRIMSRVPRRYIGH
jgi:alanine racemase